MKRSPLWGWINRPLCQDKERRLAEAILIIVGLLIGGAIGVYIGVMRGRGALAGATASLEEVRGQLAAREAELEGMRKVAQTEKVAGAEANARLESAREHFAEQRKLIEEMDKKVKESFAALSATALKANNEQFVTLAEAKMKPLREQLERYEKQIAGLEKARQQAYGGLSKELTVLGERSERLRKETGQLVAALKQPGAKGKWGEIGLRNVMELCEMSSYCDFKEQVTVGDVGSRVRPDVTVRLPGGGTLVIDAKVNTSAYLEAVEATDEAEKKRLLVKYAGDVRNTARALGGKEYWKQFQRAPEFVVMFMPGEAFFAAAVAEDSDLIRFGMESRVLLASPTTLAALLMAVRHGWQQQQVAENAEHIAAAGRELYERLCLFVTHLDKVRAGIQKAAEAYDDAVGNWERRTVPSAKKLKELGAADASRKLVELKPTDVKMRSLPASEDVDTTA